MEKGHSTNYGYQLVGICVLYPFGLASNQ